MSSTLSWLFSESSKFSPVSTTPLQALLSATFSEELRGALDPAENLVTEISTLNSVLDSFKKVNRSSDALQMLESCIKIDTSYTPAYLLMAKLHDVDGRKKMVGQLLRQVVQLHPENPDHLAEYAGWLYDQGNGLKLISLKYYQRALRHVAPHRKSLLGMTKILRAQGQLPRVHQITLRSHIMARAERGNQIFTGDLYFRSWQLQREFQQLSNSPNIQDIGNTFPESLVLAKISPVEKSNNHSESET
ncbi:hypothetical protein RUM43_005972 [Polyplax serrata]|uniref:Tetratricopeptide repeat protein n=1 Tax=Polyplax serrata TaxID=468196 RepID=A0AAN8S1U6_POLSC